MAILFISITGQIKSSIFEGGVFVDVSFTVFGKNGNNQLGNNRKKDIENVLNEEFCNLNAHSEDNSCFIQSLDFLVKKDYQLWNRVSLSFRILLSKFQMFKILIRGWNLGGQPRGQAGLPWEQGGSQSLEGLSSNFFFYIPIGAH